MSSDPANENGQQRSRMNELLISSVPLFASLPAHEIHYLANTLRQWEIPPETTLFREGEYGDRFYIVLEGQIEIIKALGTTDERVMSVRGAGEYIGEMSLFNRDGLRTASVRTRTPVQVLEMSRTDFDALLDRQPTLAYEMVRVLSARLRESQNATIWELREKNQQLQQAYEELKAAQAQIIAKEKLEHELKMAREVQASLIPRETPRLPGWDFAARWLPARDVSGDFYDFIPISQTGESPPAPLYGIAIADVSDKGMPAALFMALTRSIVRASVTGSNSPAECITQANRLICADAPMGMFVTLFYAQLDPATGELTYVNAGHNPPLIYRAAKDAWVELRRTGIALGIFSMYQLSEQTIQLNPGDLLFLYTDGVVEASNPQEEKFGVESLRQIIRANHQAAAAELVETLDQAICGFTDSAPAFDDVTFVVVKRL
jgi:phosphoserine phosphatase RsbU/P